MSISPHEAHILVVEDNVPNFVLIARLLAHMGVNHCEWKTSGWQVVQFADTLPRLDLILMDIGLPDCDGITLIRQIRTRLPAIPIIAATAFAMVDERERCLEAGCTEYLRKPYDLTALMELLQRYEGNYQGDS